MAQSIVPNVNPGTVIGSIPTFSTNATLVGDFLYVRDENGNALSGRTVDAGDEVTVLDISASKQLVLLQYPTSRGYVQGYVNNDTNIIKYKNGYNWSNGSTPEPVYDLDKTTQIGSLDPSETAVILYTVDGMTAVVYDTGKGKLTKSGLVQYTGTANSSGSSSGNGFNGVRPGDVVPGGFTYPNNAEVVGDELYLRDQNGNMIQGRSVSIGDKITVLDVGYTKQLALVQYPAGNVVRQGYVTNAPNLIKYFKPYQWHNGSTEEQVLDENGQHLGSLSKYESATPLYIKNGLTHVVYNTNKGPHTKSGFVRYEGGPAKTISIPYITVSGAEKMEYGKSGLGRPLIAHKIGNGNKALVFVCEVHGFEDNWPNDGLALVTIGNKLIEHLASNGTNGWSVYVIPSANPDGLAEGYTDHGPGRCTIVGGVDINRDFPPGFSKHGSSRNWSGDYPLSVKESKCLSEFLLDIKSKHNELFVIDLHGWEGSALGDQEIKKHFLQQFPGSRSLGFDRRGFLTAWTKEKLDATSALIELPNDTSSLQQVLDRGYPEKVIKAVDSLLSHNSGDSSHSSSGSSSHSSSSVSETTLNKTGIVIKVETHLNVRQGPGLSYDEIGKLYQGNMVSIVAQSGSWYKIKYGSSYGYVSSEFISTNISSSSTTVNNNNLSDMDEFCIVLKDLYNAAGNFYSNNVSIEKRNHLVLDYLRSHEYGPNGKESNFVGVAWDVLLFSHKYSDFEKSLNQNLKESSQCYVFNNMKLGKSKLEVPHWAATTLGYCNCNLVPKYWTGWGGDFATLLGEVLANGINQDQETLYNKALNLLANSTSSFSDSDFYEDIDAIYFAQNIDTAPIYELVKNYYSNLEYKRKQLIIDDIGGDSSDNLETRIYKKFDGYEGLSMPVDFISDNFTLLRSLGLRFFIYKGANKHIAPALINDHAVKAVSRAFATKIRQLENGYLR